jgi:hypothetical protein
VVLSINDPIVHRLYFSFKCELIKSILLVEKCLCVSYAVVVAGDMVGLIAVAVAAH